MRKFWTEQEILDLKYNYETLGKSISEFYDEFILKYPHRTKISIEVKIGKLKLKHSKNQISELKSRLNLGDKNGMYNKVGPNKGLNKNNCERIKIASKKISETRKQMYKDGLLDISGEKNGMFGKESWCKGKTKYTSEKIKEISKKISINKKEQWKMFSEEQKNNIIGRLTLAANKARKDTKIEIIVKDALEKMNIEFIKNYRCNNGKYIFDFYLTKYNFVIECQGDYWHGNPEYFKTLNNIQLKNINRDINKINFLKENDINFLFLWENEIYKNKNNLDKIINEKLLNNI